MENIENMLIHNIGMRAQSFDIQIHFMEVIFFVGCCCCCVSSFHSFLATEICLSIEKPDMSTTNKCMFIIHACCHQLIYIYMVPSAMLK